MSKKMTDKEKISKEKEILEVAKMRAMKMAAYDIPWETITFNHEASTVHASLGMEELDKTVIDAFFAKLVTAGSKSGMLEVVLNNINNPTVLFIVGRAVAQMLVELNEEQGKEDSE